MTTAVPAARPLLQKRQDLRDQRLGEAERGFVAQQYFRPRRKGLRQRHHLLLAAAEVARRLVQFLAQDRKHLERRTRERLERRPAAMHRGAEADVVGDGEVWKHPMTVQHQAQAAPREFLRRCAR